MKKNKIFMILSTSAISAIMSAAVSMPVYAKATAIDVNAKDDNVYEYQLQDLKDSALAEMLNGISDPGAKLYNDFVQRKVSTKAYYDDVRKAYIDFDLISKAAIDAALSGGTKTFDFKTFMEDTTNATTTVTANKVAIDDNGNITIKSPFGNNTDLSDGNTHTSDYVISTAGTFGSTDTAKTTTINGNVSINDTGASAADSIILHNLNINGKLTVDFGEGSLKLDNVKVNGVDISNVGSHSIAVDGASTIGNLNVNDETNNAHVVVSENASIASTTIHSGAELEVAADATNAHPFESVTISPAATPSDSNTVTLAGGTFGNVVVDGAANVAVASGATLQSIAANSDLNLSGTGTIGILTVNSAGANVNLQAASIGTVLVSSTATGATIAIPSGTTVDTLNDNAPVAVTGTGTIVTANLGVSGTTIQTRPAKVQVVAGVTATVGGQAVNSGNATVITGIPMDSTPATPVVTPPYSGGGVSYISVSAINVTGTTTVGQTLTANTTPADATVSYQWMSSDSATETFTNITGATSKTYTLTDADLNRYIKVVVTGTGIYTGTQTSAATSGVAPATVAPTKAAFTFNSNGTAELDSVDTTEEYSVNNGQLWSPVTSTTGTQLITSTNELNSLNSDATNSVQVRYKANGNTPASNAQIIQLTPSPAAPNLTFSFGTYDANHKLIGTLSGSVQYSIDGGVIWKNVDSSNNLQPGDADSINTTNGVWIRTQATGITKASNVEKITISQAGAPTVNSTVTSSTPTQTTVKLSTLQSGLEYRVKAANTTGDWTAFDSATKTASVPVTQAGSIEVRSQAVGTVAPGYATTITVQAAPSATIDYTNEQITGVDGSTMEWSTDQTHWHTFSGNTIDLNGSNKLIPPTGSQPVYVIYTPTDSSVELTQASLTINARPVAMVTTGINAAITTSTSTGVIKIGGLTPGQSSAYDVITSTDGNTWSDTSTTITNTDSNGYGSINVATGVRYIKIRLKATTSNFASSYSNVINLTASTPAAPVTGATVDTVATVASKTYSSITVNAAAASTNPGRQAIEYAISQDGVTAPTTGYQSNLIFTGLTASTAYYVWARTAANPGYDAGTAVVSAKITTDATVAVEASSNGIATVTGTTTITLGQAITGLSAGDIVVKKDGRELISGTNYTLGTLTGTTIDITFTSSARLTKNSVVTVEITKAGYTINGGAPISVANTIKS